MVLVNLDKRTLDKGTIFSYILGLFQSPAEFYFKVVYEIVNSFTDRTLSYKLRIIPCNMYNKYYLVGKTFHSPLWHSAEYIPAGA